MEFIGSNSKVQYQALHLGFSLYLLVHSHPTFPLSAYILLQHVSIAFNKKGRVSLFSHLGT